MTTMTPLPELTPILKQLRLSGLLESLETRNREAIENKLTYPEFLALMIQDEAARRDQKKYDMRLRRSGFRGDKTLEGFDFNFNPGLNQALINELARCGFVDEKVAVLIAGPCGTGKSHLLIGLGHAACEQGLRVRYVTAAGLVNELAEAADERVLAELTFRVGDARAKQLDGLRPHLGHGHAYRGQGRAGHPCHPRVIEAHDGQVSGRSSLRRRPASCPSPTTRPARPGTRPHPRRRPVRRWVRAGIRSGCGTRSIGVWRTGACES